VKPVFIGACGRSGTTLLAALLAEHPAVVAPPEAQFLIKGLRAAAAAPPTRKAERFASTIRADWRLKLWGLSETQLPGDASDPTEAMQALARRYADSRGTPDADVWVDHTPHNILYARTLLDAFPDSILIHLVRDPRAVAASVIPLDWGPAAPRDAARWWLTRVGAGLAAEAALPDRVIRVRYEDVVRDPGAVEDIHERLLLAPAAAGARGSAAMDVPRYTRSQHALVAVRPDETRIDAWRAKLSTEAVSIIESELGDTLALLGYEPMTPQPAVARPRGPAEAAEVAVRTAHQRVRHLVRRARLADR
jgi:hypothetical protein